MKRRTLLAAPLLALPLAARAQPLPDAAPLFAASFEDMTGKPLALASLRGKPLLVNFWARWCAPCRDEIPELVQAYERHRGRGLVILGIGLETEAEKVRDFAQAYQMSYPVLMGEDKALGLMQALGNRRAGLPFTLAVDAGGLVAGQHLGVLREGDLDRLLALVLPALK